MNSTLSKANYYVFIVIFTLFSQTVFCLPITLGYVAKPDVIHYPKSVDDTHSEYMLTILMLNTLQSVEENPLSRKRESYTAQELGDLFFNHPFGVNSFYLEASYEKVQFSGTVVGWIDRPDLNPSEEDIRNNMDFYFNLFNDYITFSDYDIFVFHALIEGRGAQIGWLYPQQSFVTDQGRIDGVGIDWMINSAVFDKTPELDEMSYWSSGDSILPTTSWAHEILHTLGIFGHANSYNCGEDIIALSGEENPIKAYGNPFTLMGENAFSVHPDVVMKSRMGWLEDNQVLDVTESGIYTIYPIETADLNVKGIRIPLEPTIDHNKHNLIFDYMYLEYRDNIGFDRYMIRLDRNEDNDVHSFLKWYKPEGRIDRNGILVYLRMETPDHESTVLLDMNPTTSYNPDRGIKWPGNVGKFADAILPAGDVFSFPYGDSDTRFVLAPLGKTVDGGMEILIAFVPVISGNTGNVP